MSKQQSKTKDTKTNQMIFMKHTLSGLYFLYKTNQGIVRKEEENHTKIVKENNWQLNAAVWLRKKT